jgi:branched-chain amino acid transport system ATP-binding protein
LKKKCDEVLERYKMAPYRDQSVSVLSQGVRKLLDIAMAVISKPRILLLDEPTSGISVEEKFDFMDVVMGALRKDDVTVLFIEHDMEIIGRYVSRVLAFYQGEIIADKPPTEALQDPKVQEFVIGKQRKKPKTGA